MKFEKNSKQPPQQSTFITVLAWIFIVLGGFATLISLLQNIMIHTIFPKEQMAQAMQQAEQTDQIPMFAQLIFNYFDLFALAILLLTAISFISAIALLKRKNWARIIFIVLMSIGIAWNIIGIVLQFTFFNSMPAFTGGQPVPPEFQDMMQIMKFASIIMVVIFSIFFGFVIKKLCSKRIKEEFT